MYLPSKTKLKYLAIYSLAIFLLFLPFKGIIQNAFVFFFHQITITPKESFQLIDKLKKENISLRLQAEEFKILKKENQQLKEILNFKKAKDINFIGAEILHFSSSSWQRHVIINAGKDENLEKGLLAINTRGHLIGKITEVKKSFSILTLVNDPNFNLSVFIGETSNGLLKGNLFGAKILYIESKDIVKKGDKVWVKPPSCSLPIIIGKIKNIKKRKSALFCDVAVELAHQSTFFNKIFIIK